MLPSKNNTVKRYIKGYKISLHFFLWIYIKKDIKYTGFPNFSHILDEMPAYENIGDFDEAPYKHHLQNWQFDLYFSTF